MNMLEIAKLLLAAYGFAWFLGRSKLTLGFRRWLAQVPSPWLLALLECPGCVGFWTGYLYVARRSWDTFVPAVLTGFVVLTTNLLLESITSHIKE